MRERVEGEPGALEGLGRVEGDGRAGAMPMVQRPPSRWQEGPAAAGTGVSPAARVRRVAPLTASVLNRVVGVVHLVTATGRWWLAVLFCTVALALLVPRRA